MTHPRRKAKPEAQPVRIAAGTTTGTYKPVWQPLRPNADQHEQIPSRAGDSLYYRDGRKETV